jgi:hypothetical protein
VNGKAWLDALLGDELVTYRARVRPADVVFVKSVLEASEGLGTIFAEPRGVCTDPMSRDGGAVVIAGPRSRSKELAETIRDLRAELDVLEVVEAAPRTC